MKKEKLSFDAFESLSENAEGKLVSGFSPAFEGEELMGGDGTNIICIPNTNCPSCSGGGSGKG